ncbi:MAG: PIG-L family deacetylase [Candidatus Dormibacteraeota bacterium]|nr:PIG-L family deacetylase [Candidatus Dormibacteraeota bacterium]
MRARLSDVPFRLLGVVADPGQAADLCGQAFARYAISGTDITLVCAGAHGWPGTDQLPEVRRLGVRDLVLLDYDVRELTAVALEDLFADVMATVRPHVVVAEGTLPALKDATASAFSRVRRAAGGSSALPAKLYYRFSDSNPLASVTTAITVGGESAELFVRAFPDPWVTGVLERDLFAGVPAEGPAPSTLEERFAG